MKDQLKKVISKEYEGILPSNLESLVSKAVFQAILKPKPWYQTLRREDIVLILSVVAFVVFAYFIGFNADYQVTITVSRDIQNCLGIAICSVSVGLYLFLNEYFEGKKKIIH